MDINSIDKFYICYIIIILQYAIRKTKRIKRQKRYAQNKDAAKLYMMEYHEKKKDLIQFSNNEYYKSNEYKIKRK